MENKNVNMRSGGSRPVLKWPGGKRWIAPQLSSFIESVLSNTYYEPFLGGGAVFFQLRPKSAVLSDVNQELIQTYRQIRDRPKKIEEALETMPVDEEAYYLVRSSRPSGAFEKAVRFLYLNRTSYGGLYRLNSKGEFNVPFGKGRTPEILIRERLIRVASKALKSAELRVADFEDTLSRAGHGDVVYCDPAYTVAHNSNAFVRYNEKNFSWADQLRLVSAARNAQKRGATVLITNAAHESIYRLYHPFRPIKLWRNNNMALPSKGRPRVDEYLFALLPSHHMAKRKELISLFDKRKSGYEKGRD